MGRLASHSDRIAWRGAVLVLLAVTALGCAPRGGGVGKRTMVLEICGARKILNPTDEQIRTELGNLSTKNVDAYAVMGPSEMTYIQAAGDKTVGFHLEYQDGSVDAHFQATNGTRRPGTVRREGEGT